MSTPKIESRQQKERLAELFSQIGRALANPHRLELLDLLIQAPRTVEDLANQAHCRGPYCADAGEALILLSSYGYLVKRMEEGAIRRGDPPLLNETSFSTVPGVEESPVCPERVAPTPHTI